MRECPAIAMYFLVLCCGRIQSTYDLLLVITVRITPNIPNNHVMSDCRKSILKMIAIFIVVIDKDFNLKFCLQYVINKKKLLFFIYTRIFRKEKSC